MPTPEGAFKGRFTKMLESLDDCWHWNTHDTYKKGLPDTIGSYRGSAFAFELKVDAAVDPLQKIELHRIARSGAFAGVVRSRKGTIVWTRYRSNEVEPDRLFGSLEAFRDFIALELILL